MAVEPLFDFHVLSLHRADTLLCVALVDFVIHAFSPDDSLGDVNGLACTFLCSIEALLADSSRASGLRSFRRDVALKL